MFLKSNDEFNGIYNAPYASDFGSLMNVMVYITLGITKPIGVLRYFMSNTSDNPPPLKKGCKIFPTWLFSVT